MWNKIKNKVLEIKQAAGIEVCINDDGSYSINGAISSLKGNSIVLDSFFYFIKDMSVLKTRIPAGIPVALVLSGKGVLIKMVSDQNPANPFQSLISSSNPTDFYSENIKSGNNQIISICRKDSIQTILEWFKENKHRVLSMQLGFSVINNILPYLNCDGNNKVDTSAYSISLSDGNISGFKTLNHNPVLSTMEYSVADQYIQSPILLAFAASIGLFVRSTDAHLSNTQILQEEIEDFRYNRLFRFWTVTMLIFFLSTLLLSFTIYNKYFNRNKSLIQSQSYITNQEQKTRTLQREISRKERFLEKSGWIKNTKTSYYSDRIAGLVPGGIHLTSLIIYPARKNSTGDLSGCIFKKDTIIAAGFSENPSELNKFSSGLQLLPDFKEVQIKSYSMKTETSQGQFVMEILTK